MELALKIGLDIQLTIIQITQVEVQTRISQTVYSDVTTVIIASVIRKEHPKIKMTLPTITSS